MERHHPLTLPSICSIVLAVLVTILYKMDFDAKPVAPKRGEGELMGPMLALGVVDEPVAGAGHAWAPASGQHRDNAQIVYFTIERALSFVP